PLSKLLNLNPASGEFAEDLPAAGRCKAANPPLPRGKLFSKTAAFTAPFGLMHEMQARHFNNLLILKI
ncbi:MAG: hypothetical protein DRH37_10460, partial [Deltaproteobacteria bacterium]